VKITTITNPSDDPVKVLLRSQTGNSFLCTIQPHEAVLSFGHVTVVDPHLFVQGFFNEQGILLYMDYGNPLLVQNGNEAKSYFFVLGFSSYNIQYGIDTGEPVLYFPATLKMPKQTMISMGGAVERAFYGNSSFIQGSICLLEPIMLQAACQYSWDLTIGLQANLIGSKADFLYKVQGYYSYLNRTNEYILGAIYHGVPISASVFTTAQTQKAVSAATKFLGKTRSYRYVNGALSVRRFAGLGIWGDLVKRLDNGIASDIIGKKWTVKFLSGLVTRLFHIDHYMYADVTYMSRKDLHLYGKALYRYKLTNNIGAVIIPSTGWWIYQNLMGGSVLKNPLFVYGRIFGLKRSLHNLSAAISEQVQLPLTLQFTANTKGYSVILPINAQTRFGNNPKVTVNAYIQEIYADSPWWHSFGGFIVYNDGSFTDDRQSWITSYILHEGDPIPDQNFTGTVIDETLPAPFGVYGAIQ